jgi:hypothetical protein
MKSKAVLATALLGVASLCAATPTYIYQVSIPGLVATPNAASSAIQIVSTSGAGAYADGTYAQSCLGT